MNCYNEIEKRGMVNQSEEIYTMHFFFCNTYELLNPKIQQRIKEYNYAKAFNCPPYPSIQETPAQVVDDFLQIENIMLNIKKENNG